MPRSLTTIDSWAACRGLIHGRLTARIPRRQGKKQGISRNRPLFCETNLQSNCKCSGLRDEFPTRRRRELFRARRELLPAFLTGAGNFAQTRSARPDASDRLKGFSFDGKKIINGRVMLRLGTKPFTSPDRPRGPAAIQMNQGAS